MTVILQAVIDGEPRSKGRAKYNRATGQVYKGAEDRDGEERIAWEVKAQNPGLDLNDSHDLGVSLKFYCSDRQRRDIDNMTKAVFDALNGVAWRDDMQVIRLSAEIHRDGTESRTELEVFTVGESLEKDCIVCGKPLPRVRRRFDRAKFCSMECRNEYQRKGESVPCSVCGTVVYRQIGKIETNQDHFCSIECRSVGFKADPPRTRAKRKAEAD